MTFILRGHCGGNRIRTDIWWVKATHTQPLYDTAVEIDGFEPSPVIFSQICTLTALAAFALGAHSTLLSYIPIICGHMWDSNPSETVQMSRASQLHYTAHICTPIGSRTRIPGLRIRSPEPLADRSIFQ